MYDKKYFKQLKDVVDEMQKEVEITTAQLEIAREWVIVNCFSNIDTYLNLISEFTMRMQLTTYQILGDFNAYAENCCCGFKVPFSDSLVARALEHRITMQRDHIDSIRLFLDTIREQRFKLP